MVSSISAISSSGFGSSSLIQPLSEITRQKLQNLGIDASNIKTEQEGQTKIQEAQSAQANQQPQAIQQQQSIGQNSQMDSIKEQALELADKIGVSLPKNAKLSEIMEKISDKITSMQAQAAKDPSKAAEVAKYAAEFQSLAQTVSNMQTSKQASQAVGDKLQSSMSALAAYNLASLSFSNSQLNTQTKLK